MAQHRDPQQSRVDINAFNDPEAWRGLARGKSAREHGGQRTEHNECQQSRQRIDAEPLAEREGAETHREEQEQYEHTRENDVWCVGYQAAGTALVHREQVGTRQSNDGDSNSPVADQHG